MQFAWSRCRLRDLLIDKLAKESVRIWCSLLIIDNRQSINPMRYDLRNILDFAVVEMQDLRDTRAGILGGESIIFTPCVGSLRHLE